MRNLSISLTFIATVVVFTSSQAAVIRVTENNFSADAGLITFSEVAMNTYNPVYTPDMYGADSSGATVTFGGWFNGQSLGKPGVDCPSGAGAQGCVVGNPTGSLSIDINAPKVFVTQDGANPASPVLSGTPRFNGVISMIFDKDVTGVGLDGGHFDAAKGTAITAFSRDGSVIGSVTNEGLGIEFLGLVSDAGDEIAGLQFSLVGPEPAGFAIDNLRFGFANQIIDVPGKNVPEPTTIALLALGLMGIGAIRRSKNV